MPHARTSLPRIGKSLFARAVLIDTGAILSLRNARDVHHIDAVECIEAVAGRRLPLFIAIPTIYETQRRILFDMGAAAALDFLNNVFDGSMNVVRNEDADEQEARRLIGRYADLKLTLTDAANMAIMDRIGISTVFSFDAHFLLAGYLRIPPFHLLV